MDGRCHGPEGQIDGRDVFFFLRAALNKTKHQHQLISSESSGVGPHIDPDVAGLLVDDEGLNSVSESL